MAAAVEFDEASISQIPPLKVTLTGLGTTYSQLRHLLVKFCSGIATDSSNSLPSFAREVRQNFTSAGISEERRLRSRLLGPDLIHPRHIKQLENYAYLDGHIVRKGRQEADYNARGLVEKYKDFEFAREIRLEKLSLVKEGRKAPFAGTNNEFLVNEEYEEIESIPLP
ncbi:hypothetical protein MMC28_008159 [Mycoblastus sanguinarius]|nr:hypothetical protein [Mycoblastus sanguinarius]